MKYLFIAPIDLRKNRSAGAETINIYINNVLKLGNDVAIISRIPGSYISDSVANYVIGEETETEKKRGKIIKTLGWILYPRQKYLYKITRHTRDKILNSLSKLIDCGYMPDIVVLETTSSILLVDLIRKYAPNAVMVASLHDFAYQGSLRRYEFETSNIKKFFRKRYIKWAKRNEIGSLNSSDIVCPHNKDNTRLLYDNGLDPDKIVFPLVPYFETNYNHGKQHDNTLLFYGLMSRPENYESAIWFIKNVIPQLESKFVFVVMGGNPIEKLKKYASERIIITGYASEEEVKKYFSNSLCLVAPLVFGSGIKTKILSAMSCGLPVITNKIGIEGIPGRDGEDFLLCDTVKEYCDSVLELSNDDLLYNKISHNGKELIKNNYDHYANAEEYNSILTMLVEKSKS